LRTPATRLTRSPARSRSRPPRCCRERWRTASSSRADSRAACSRSSIRPGRSRSTWSPARTEELRRSSAPLSCAPRDASSTATCTCRPHCSNRLEKGGSMDLGLKGKNAAITGSSQGIGLAIATALAKEGCNVALSARGAQGLGIAVKEIEALGVRAVGVVADFASEEGCSKFVAEAASQLGGLDILVNNVGGLIPGAFEQLSAEQWEKILNLKLMAAVHTTKHALPYL